VPKVELCFRTCLLPKLLGNWYTRPTEFPHVNPESPDANSEPQDTSSEPVCCYCCKVEDGIMIACLLN